MADSPRSSGPADRNLLFGILALQMDFISRDQLVAGMHAWVLSKEKPLGHILCAQGALKTDENALLDALVQKHLDKHGGDAQRSLAALSSVPPLHLELAKVQDQDVQASLAQLPHGPAGRREQAASYGTIAQAAAPDSSSLLRFRILRPHARGGLGEVFVAEDAELHREVALKEIQNRHADRADSRSRFLLEAEITGGLEHPGIVPVYSLGHYADGRPFYAMRFIKGDSLAEAIERFHAAGVEKQPAGERLLALRGLLRRFVDVCNAIAYAHSRGVLHRDLKPGNIMLGKYGETLVVDWGLAKAMGRTEAATTLAEQPLHPHSGNSSTPTQMGYAIGTPAYMSPEQAEGRLSELGPASDVYSLGATLCHILTGKPPFEGDPHEVIRKVQRGEVVPPRKLHPEIPRPLEAICLKAMALRPAERYATPLDLAGEVEHWLADEPILAFREPLYVRLGRWRRRHPALVAGAAALLMTATVGLATGLFFVNAEKNLTELARQDATTQAELARTSELEAKKQAELARTNERIAKENDAISQGVLDFVENKVIAAARPEGLDGGLGYDVKLRDAIKNALPFVTQSFTKQPLVEARLRLTMGSSFTYLGDAATAAEQFEAARKLFKEHLGPDHPYTLSSMNNLAVAYEDLGRHTDALKLNEETLALRRAKLGPDHPETLKSMANLAGSYSYVGRPADAMKLYEETVALMKTKLGPDHPDTLASMNNLSACYGDLGRHLEALKLREETLALKKAKLGPDHPDTLASMHNLAVGYSDLGRHADALKLLEETVALKKAKLGADHPETLLSMMTLANTYSALARHAEAVKIQEQTLERMRTKLGPDHPQTLLCMGNLANSLIALKRGAEAMPIIDECLKRAEGRTVDPRLVLFVVDIRFRYFERSKDAAGCRETAGLWDKLKRTDFESLYNAACFRAVTASVIKQDATTPSADADRLAKTESDLAMAWLKKAVTAGFMDTAHMAQDKDLDALRDRDDFKKLVAEMESAKKKEIK